LLRTCNRAIVALVLLLGIVLVAGNSSPVSADSCIAQVNYPVTPTTYYTSNFQMVVPVSATCSFSGGQLYAVGNVYDTSTNNNLGSTNTVLTPVDGGNVFNGQLMLTLPLVQGDTLQVTVSIYSNGPNGTLLTSATQTVQVNGINYYAAPSDYWYYPWNPSYQWSPSYPSYPSSPSPPPAYHDHPTPPTTPPGHHDNPTPPSTPPGHHGPSPSPHH
jgi:hypothetical protein